MPLIEVLDIDVDVLSSDALLQINRIEQSSRVALLECVSQGVGRSTGFWGHCGNRLWCFARCAVGGRSRRTLKLWLIRIRSRTLLVRTDRIRWGFGFR